MTLPVVRDLRAALSTEAAVEWDIVIMPAMSAGVIAVTDTAVAMAYCEAVARLSRARAVQAKIEDEGEHGGFIIRDSETGKLVANPMLKIINAEWREVVYYAAELRMTPRSR